MCHLQWIAHTPGSFFRIHCFYCFIVIFSNTDFLRTFSFIFIFLLAPEEGLFSNRNVRQICLNIYFLFYSFVYFFIVMRKGSVCRFIFLYKLLFYCSRSTSGRSGTTHWFVAVDLLIFYIFWYLSSSYIYFQNATSMRHASKTRVELFLISQSCRDLTRYEARYENTTTTTTTTKTNK